MSEKDKQDKPKKDESKKKSTEAAKKTSLQKISAPKMPIKKVTLEEMIKEEQEKGLVDADLEVEQIKKEFEASLKIPQPTAKKPSRPKAGRVKDVISGLDKHFGGEGEIDYRESEDVSDEAEEDHSSFLQYIQDTGRISPGFRELGASDDIYSYESDDLSFPVSPSELDEIQSRRMQKELEMEKKAKKKKKDSAQALKLTLSGIKGKIFPTNVQSKTARRVGIALIILVLLVPIIFIVPAYNKNCSRQLLVSPYLGYMVWKEDASSRVDDNFMPAFAEKFVNHSIEIEQMKGETEYFKFVIKSIFTSERIARVSITDFVNNEKNTTIDKSSLNLLKEVKDEYVFYADKLGKAESEFTLLPNTNYPIYLEFNCPEVIEAGVYSGNLSLVLGDVTQDISIALTVVDVQLPSHSKMMFFSENILDSVNVVDSLQALNVYSGRIEFDYTHDPLAKTFSFNWTNFDIIMAAAVSKGFKNIDVSFRWNVPKEEIIVFGSSFNESVIDAYTKIWSHLSANNWTDYSIVDLGYSYTDSEIEDVSKMIKLIKSVSSDIKILAGAPLSIETLKAFSKVDIWAISQVDLQNSAYLVDSLLSSGKDILIAIEPKTQMPFMNLKLTNPLIHARLIPLLVFRFNVYGLYFYNTSDARENAFGYGEDGLLSGLLLYREGDTIIPSLRFLMLAQGLEDLGLYTKTEQIAQTFQDTEKGENALTAINKLKPLIISYSEISIDASKYDAIRSEMISIIVG